MQDSQKVDGKELYVMPASAQYSGKRHMLVRREMFRIIDKAGIHLRELIELDIKSRAFLRPDSPRRYSD